MSTTAVAAEDVVVFDVRFAARALRDHLQPDRAAWLESRDGDQVVAVALGGGPDDLASLLRTVEKQLVERGYSRMRFELDGRAYSLRLRP